MAPLPKVVSLMLLLVALFAGGALLCSGAPATFTQTLVVTPQSLTLGAYLSFMSDLDFAVNATAEEWIRLHPVLRRQTLRTAPSFWLNVELADAAGQRLVTLALRSDNLYLAGFANRAGEWFAFKGQQATLPGSTELSYTGGYPDIFGRVDGYRGLASVPINGLQAFANALQLSNFHPGGPSPDATLKPALGFFILAIAEAERFPAIRAAIARAMEAPAPQTIGNRMAELAVNWADLSCALRAWDKFGQRDAVWMANKEAHKLASKIAVRDADQALAEVEPILRGTRCSWTH